MKKKIIIALTIVLCFSIMVIKKASACSFYDGENHISKLENWQGTPVPNSGYIGKIYFNIAISNDEINQLYASLIFIETPLTRNDIVPILVDENGKALFWTADNFICYSENLTNGEYATFKGSHYTWEYSEIEINSNVINNLYGISIGTQNEQLSSLISITPFVYKPSLQDGMADGWQVGYDEGYEQGWNEGEREGYNDGCVDGYQEGYDVGIKKGEEVNANLGDMFLNILDSPRQAISNILNFEFLGINLASLVFFLITAILVVVIIKFFI